MADKVEWLNKLRKVIGVKGGQAKGENGTPMRQSLSDGSLVSTKQLYRTCVLIKLDISYVSITILGCYIKEIEII